VVKLVLLLILLAGCTTVPKGTFCQLADPVRLSDSAVDALSDAEVKALLAHNRKGAKLCGWKP
jgi:hypothetical protein